MAVPLLVAPRAEDGPRAPHLAALHAPCAYVARVRAEYALADADLAAFERYMYGCELRSAEAANTPPPTDLLVGYAAYVLLRVHRARRAAKLRGAAPVRRLDSLACLLAHGFAPVSAHATLALLTERLGEAEAASSSASASASAAVPAPATALRAMLRAQHAQHEGERARARESHASAALLDTLDSVPRHPHVVSRIRAARVLTRYERAACPDALAAWLEPDLRRAPAVPPPMLGRSELLDALVCLCARRTLGADAAAAAARMRADRAAWTATRDALAGHCTCHGASASAQARS